MISKLYMHLIHSAMYHEILIFVLQDRWAKKKKPESEGTENK